MTALPPIPDSFTTLIASRVVELSNKEGIKKITVEVGLPIQDVKTVSGYDWRCPVRFKIFGDSIINDYACGVDSYQALELTMQLISSTLQNIAEEHNAQILLFGQQSV